MTLTNGQVIWDFAGNVWEWIQGQASGRQPGVDGSDYVWHHWTDLNNPGNLSINPFPSGTGLNGSSSWNGSNGVGRVNSSSGSLAVGFMRSGGWSNNAASGVTGLSLGTLLSYSISSLGFRVDR